MTKRKAAVSPIKSHLPWADLQGLSTQQSAFQRSHPALRKQILSLKFDQGHQDYASYLNIHNAQSQVDALRAREGRPSPYKHPDGPQPWYNPMDSTMQMNRVSYSPNSKPIFDAEMGGPSGKLQKLVDNMDIDPDPHLSPLYGNAKWQKDHESLVSGRHGFQGGYEPELDEGGGISYHKGGAWTNTMGKRVPVAHVIKPVLGVNKDKMVPSDPDQEVQYFAVSSIPGDEGQIYRTLQGAAARPSSLGNRWNHPGRGHSPRPLSEGFMNNQSGGRKTVAAVVPGDPQHGLGTGHTAPKSGPTMDDPVDAGLQDVYDHPEYYVSPRDARDPLVHRSGMESWRAVKAVRGNPDALVKIYRAVPHGVTDIEGHTNPAGASWVSASPSYAQRHANAESCPSCGGDMQVISGTARAGDLHNEGYLEEWGYTGDPIHDASALTECPEGAYEARKASEAEFMKRMGAAAIPDEPEFDMPQAHKDWLTRRGWQPREEPASGDTFAAHFTKMTPSGLRHSIYWDGRRAYNSDKPIYQLATSVPARGIGTRDIKSHGQYVYETSDLNDLVNKAKDNEKSWLLGDQQQGGEPGLLKFMDPDNDEYDRRHWAEQTSESPAGSVGSKPFVEPKENIHPYWRGGPEGRSGLHRLNSAIPDESGIKAAGIAVIALDTGRVLMQQRALNPIMCPCGMGVTWDEQNGYQHDDGSVSHDGEYYGQSVSDLLDQGHPDPIPCSCCQGAGDNKEGSECTSCDGSGLDSDLPPCDPTCREPGLTREAAYEDSGLYEDPATGEAVDVDGERWDVHADPSGLGIPLLKSVYPDGTKHEISHDDHNGLSMGWNHKINEETHNHPSLSSAISCADDNNIESEDFFRHTGGLYSTAALEFDPNEGTWEFPGGKLDPGESPRAAAIREFREEVGQDLPPGVFVGAWVSPGGIVVSASALEEPFTQHQRDLAALGWKKVDPYSWNLDDPQTGTQHSADWDDGTWHLTSSAPEGWGVPQEWHQLSPQAAKDTEDAHRYRESEHDSPEALHGQAKVNSASYGGLGEMAVKSLDPKSHPLIGDFNRFMDYTPDPTHDPMHRLNAAGDLPQRNQPNPPEEHLNALTESGWRMRHPEQSRALPDFTKLSPSTGITHQLSWGRLGRPGWHYDAMVPDTNDVGGYRVVNEADPKRTMMGKGSVPVSGPEEANKAYKNYERSWLMGSPHGESGVVHHFDPKAEKELMWQRTPESSERTREGNPVTGTHPEPDVYYGDFDPDWHDYDEFRENPHAGGLGKLNSVEKTATYQPPFGDVMDFQGLGWTKIDPESNHQWEKKNHGFLHEAVYDQDENSPTGYSWRVNSLGDNQLIGDMDSYHLTPQDVENHTRQAEKDWYKNSLGEGEFAPPMSKTRPVMIPSEYDRNEGWGQDSTGERIRAAKPVDVWDMGKRHPLHPMQRLNGNRVDTPWQNPDGWERWKGDDRSWTGADWPEESARHPSRRDIRTLVVQPFLGVKDDHFESPEGYPPVLDDAMNKEWQPEDAEHPLHHLAARKAPVYKGFIYLIQSERDIDLGKREIANPDDPDGDMSEQSAWWEIEHARKNPALRKEVKQVPWAELELWADKSVRNNRKVVAMVQKLAMPTDEDYLNSLMFNFEPADNKNVHYHSIDAYDQDGSDHGSIQWWPQSGRVMGINVDQHNQRKGLGTELYRRAKEQAATEGVRLHHSLTLMSDGEKIIDALGDDPGGPVLEHDGNLKEDTRLTHEAGVLDHGEDPRPKLPDELKYYDHPADPYQTQNDDGEETKFWRYRDPGLVPPFNESEPAGYQIGQNESHRRSVDWQPMIITKPQSDYSDEGHFDRAISGSKTNVQWDNPICETCYLKYGATVPLGTHSWAIQEYRDNLWEPRHEFKPMSPDVDQRGNLKESSAGKAEKCMYCKEPSTKKITHSEGMAYIPVCGSHLGKGKTDAANCTPDKSHDPSNINSIKEASASPPAQSAFPLIRDVITAGRPEYSLRAPDEVDVKHHDMIADNARPVYHQEHNADPRTPQIHAVRNTGAKSYTFLAPVTHKETGEDGWLRGVANRDPSTWRHYKDDELEQAIRPTKTQTTSPVPADQRYIRQRATGIPVAGDVAEQGLESPWQEGDVPLDDEGHQLVEPRRDHWLAPDGAYWTDLNWDKPGEHPLVRSHGPEDDTLWWRALA